VAQAAMSAHTDSLGAGIDLNDIQGLLRFGFKHHTEAVFLLLRVKDAAAAREWLGHVPVASSVSQDPLPKTVLQVALSSAGMHALGVGADVVGGFSEEFIEGMAGDANRTRRLGDVGENAPEQWDWGSGNRVPHSQRYSTPCPAISRHSSGVSRHSARLASSCCIACRQPT